MVGIFGAISVRRETMYERDKMYREPDGIGL